MSHGLEYKNPSVDTLCIYAENLATKLTSAKSVKTYLGTIQLYHNHLGLHADNLSHFKYQLMLPALPLTMRHFPAQNLPITPEILNSTVDSRYLAPVGSQNLRARVKWFSRYLARNISRFRAKATTRDFQGHRPTYMTYSGVYKSQNSMLSDNKVTYVSWISTHIDLTPATNHNKQH